MKERFIAGNIPRQGQQLPNISEQLEFEVIFVSVSQNVAKTKSTMHSDNETHR